MVKESAYKKDARVGDMGDVYVTVYVLCYNSEKTITDTLDSIYSQTYKYIDLLISDDASTDESLDIINDWIKHYSERFRTVRVLKNIKNEGISKTFDSCVKSCNTEWLKVIAADDILMPECISKNIRYVKEHSINSLLYSQDLVFVKDIKTAKRREKYEQMYIKKLSTLPPKQQFRHLLHREIMFAPTTFINAETYKLIGGISTKVKNIEDSPLALSFTNSGYSINFMDEDTVYYRQGESVSRSLGYIYNRNHIQQIMVLKRELIYPFIYWYDLPFWYDELITNLRYKFVLDILGNKDSYINRIINYILMGLTFSGWKKIFLKWLYR